jgi:hypothetical protein
LRLISDVTATANTSASFAAIVVVVVDAHVEVSDFGYDHLIHI